MSRDDLGDLRLGDLTTFLVVRRCLSITSAARELSVTPSQVSKAIVRLEQQLGRTLFARTGRGVTLTDAGRDAGPLIESAVDGLRRLGRGGAESTPELTVAAPSYVAAMLLPSILSAQRTVRMRVLELAPALMRAHAGDDLFDIALLMSDVERLPPSWVSVLVGEVRSGLFASAALFKKLGAMPVEQDQLRATPFIVPLGNVNGQLVQVDDECPLHGGRIRGHEAQTVGVAMALATRCEQLVFGPVMAAGRYVEEGSLVEVRVNGWNVTNSLYLACNSDRVLAPVQRAIVKAVQTQLSALELAVPATTS